MPCDRPEEQAVLVLDLDDADGRVLGQRDAGVRVLRLVEGLDPGLVPFLELLVEEQESPQVRGAGVALDAPER